MNFILLILILNFYTANAYSKTVREWWVQCKGSYTDSTCLSNVELSKFKTICSNKSYKEDCQMVVDYVMAKTRILEGKSFLIHGYTSQVSNFRINNRFLNDIEKIWDQDKVDSAFSYVTGILPSCNATGKKKLIFSKNLRSEVKEFQNEIFKIYESLASLPCPDIKSGFVLVTIGKVLDSNKEFEVYTIDEKKNFKVIYSVLGAGPFNLMSNKLITSNEPN